MRKGPVWKSQFAAEFANDYAPAYLYKSCEGERLLFVSHREAP